MVGARHGAVMDLLPVLAEPRVALVVAHRQRLEIAVKLCRQTSYKLIHLTRYQLAANQANINYV